MPRNKPPRIVFKDIVESAYSLSNDIDDPESRKFDKLCDSDFHKETLIQASQLLPLLADEIVELRETLRRHDQTAADELATAWMRINELEASQVKTQPEKTKGKR